MKFFILLIFPTLLLANMCPNSDKLLLADFDQLEHYDPALKKCMESVEAKCKTAPADQDEAKLEELKSKAFQKIKLSKKFAQVYCTNFKNGKVDVDHDRKCKAEDVLKATKSLKSCDELIATDHEDYDVIHTYCDDMLIEEIESQISSTRKTNYYQTIERVISGFKQMHSKNPDVLKLLDSIAPVTNFRFRLTKFVAGVRTNADLGCSEFFLEEEPWCKSKYIILPGGKIFLSPERLELVMAHEIGHIINDALLPEKDYRKSINKLKSVNHMHSTYIDHKTHQSETSADIYMVKYSKKFMKDKDVSTHFCHYSTHEHHYLQSHYLHPYHRQTLLNCSHLLPN